MWRTAARLSKNNIFITVIALTALFTLGFYLGVYITPIISASPLNQGGINALSSTLPASASVEASAQAQTEQAATKPMIILAAEETTPALAKHDSATIAADEPQVVIYCTHAGEEYSGQTRTAGKAGGVMNVARVLAEAFEQHGVAIILDETLHDKVYNEAYASSLASVSHIAQMYPQIEIFIDVHRDSSIPGVSTVLATNDTSYAKMLLVVGSNEKLPHPDWQDNYAFAKEVTASCNDLIDGVMREPRVYSDRYNQHIGPRAILVEIGSTDNTQAEAERSAALLADAIISCM